MKTKVVHSISKSAWNVVGDSIGQKHKIARCPYLAIGNEEQISKERLQAFEHATFISKCFNESKV